eukprot:768637-Hanusia_phi.AAC.9
MAVQVCGASSSTSKDDDQEEARRGRSLEKEASRSQDEPGKDGEKVRDRLVADCSSRFMRGRGE